MEFFYALEIVENIVINPLVSLLLKISKICVCVTLCIPHFNSAIQNPLVGALSINPSAFMYSALLIYFHR